MFYAVVLAMFASGVLIYSLISQGGRRTRAVIRRHEAALAALAPAGGRGDPGKGRNDRSAAGDEDQDDLPAAGPVDRYWIEHFEQTYGRPGWAARLARLTGLWEPPGGRAEVVEGNARLIGATGLVLIVLLFLEGLTIPAITPELSWHIILGLALIPPLTLKIGATLWRFSRYYLHDRAYVRAGPPHPLLRVLGPIVMVSTIVLMASGIALWLAGPSDQAMFVIHRDSFIIWFGAVAVHVVSHLLRAVRLSAADARDAEGRTGSRRARWPAQRRRRAVLVSVVVGCLLGLAGRDAVGSPWFHHAVSQARPTPAAASLAPGHGPTQGSES
jgi:hypothetical protein